MGKPTGFQQWPREGAPRRPVEERLGDFRELVLPHDEGAAQKQAGRCMDCGVPFCQQGCPLGNPIPDFNEHVWHGRWREAYLALSSTNDFPEFTGRLCPAPCEAACVLAVNADPVTIEQLEKDIIERAFAEGWVQPRPPSHRTGRKVAVVGSGPAGLAAASALNRAGHEVTVFERSDAPGGLLRYGIPSFKMEKTVIDRRLRILQAEGVRFLCGQDVGQAPRWDELRRSHDAVLVTHGAGRPRELPVPGRERSGVVQAMAYLTSSAPELSAQGKRVVILGGGDTGADCLGTSHRQGASSVTQVELLPAPPGTRPPQNPWPQWPLVFRTSTSHEEGGQRVFGRMTTRLEGEGGALRRLVSVGVDVGLQPLPGTEEVWEVDLLILAMGFLGPEVSTLQAQLGVELDARGNVRTDAQFATSADGVWCAGDARRGASLIVWAISEGREAARAVDAWLTGRGSRLPTRGQDCAFGGR